MSVSTRQGPGARLLEKLPAVAWERDGRTLAFTFVTDAAEKLLGYPVEAWTETADFWQRHVHPDDLEEARAALLRSVETGEGHDLEYRMHTASGGTVWVRDTASVAVSHGRPTRLYGILHDVTAHRLALEAQALQYARVRRQNLALLALATRDTSHGRDFDDTLRAITEASAQALGVRRVGVWWLEHDRVRCLDQFDQETGHTAGTELSLDDHPAYFAAILQDRALCADDVRQDPRFAELVPDYVDDYGITSMMDAPVRVGGRVVAIVCHEHVGEMRRWTPDEQLFAGSMADLVALALAQRDRREAQRALRVSEARADAIAAASLDAMLVLDRDGRIAEFNRSAEALFGRPKAELLGLDLADTLVAEPDRARFRDVARLCGEDPGGADERLGLTLIGARGPFVAEARAFAFPEADGTRLAVFFRDLSASDAEAALRSEHARLEQLVEERSAPLRAALAQMESYGYALAHELRGPLRALDAFTRLLGEEAGEALGPAARRHLARIRAAATRMSELVRDMMLLSRVSAVELVRQPVDLGAVATSIAAELRDLDPTRQVTFDIEAPLVAACDPGLARVVLENLLRNAWKFTSRHESTRIAFFTRHVGDETVYCVQDDGAGFSPEHASRLFQPFRRLHGTDEFEGTGIGLAVVRRIVERHGGRVWAEGAVEQGATFCFTLDGNGATAAGQRSEGTAAEAGAGAETGAGTGAEAGTGTEAETASREAKPDD